MNKYTFYEMCIWANIYILWNAPTAEYAYGQNVAKICIKKYKLSISCNHTISTKKKKLSLNGKIQ